jgi:hypothetical protein
MDDSATLRLVTFVAAVAAACAAGAGGFLVRGTTAVPAAGWAAAAALALAAEMGGRAAGVLADPAAAEGVRLAVAALGLCPAMSLLGAKRPQHGVWQFIVAALAAMLALPAATAALTRPGMVPDVLDLQRGFMTLLVLVGWMNFAGTRHGVPAALVAVGQMLLMRPFLPFVPSAAEAPGSDCVAALLVAGGALAAAGISAFRPVTVGGRVGIAASIDGPFLALRETLGAAWALRIAERFNATAEARGWPCRLRFAGLDAGGDPTDSGWHRDAIRCLRALLLRFVSHEWLARHEAAIRDPNAPVLAHTRGER